jgi:signal transduction histidine kinase
VDERAAVALGTQAGIAYDNARLFDALHHRVATLEAECLSTSGGRQRVKQDERARLSRLLHDQVGQGLAGLKMDLQWLGTQLASSGTPAPDLGGHVERMVQALDGALQSVRGLSRELRPPVLGYLGLVDAIRSEAEECERRAGIRCRVDAQIDLVDIDEDRSLSVFLIVREAMTSVLRHAEATRVTVSVRGSAKWATVAVADNGRGISQRAVLGGDSLGLLAMRERAVLLGGSLDIRRRRPAGTLVSLTCPLAGKFKRRA